MCSIVLQDRSTHTHGFKQWHPYGRKYTNCWVLWVKLGQIYYDKKERTINKVIVSGHWYLIDPMKGTLLFQYSPFIYYWYLQQLTFSCHSGYCTIQKNFEFWLARKSFWKRLARPPNSWPSSPADWARPRLQLLRQSLSRQKIKFLQVGPAHLRWCWPLR